MSGKRALINALIVSGLLLLVVIGLQQSGRVRALPAPQVPGAAGVTIPYVGRLSNQAGLSVADGAYDLSFALYDIESGGQALWSEIQPGVAVQGGGFTVLLGGASPLPAALLGGERWLAAVVRGPGEAAFTPLTPRQRLSSATSAAPASATAGAACPHDHWGETWNGGTSGADNGLVLTGTRSWSLSILKATNYANGPGVWGENYGAGNGVRGQNYGSASSGIGVYGQSQNGPGVAARNTNKNYNGMEGFGKVGVYGESDSVGENTAGVCGKNVRGDGATTGVYGEVVTNAPLASGVMGYASALEGQAIAVSGYANAPDAWGGRFVSWNGNGVYISASTGKVGLSLIGGSKNAVVNTTDGGRLLYSEESSEVWFSDYGFGKLENGIAIVGIDPLFAQTVNLQEPYHVFVQAYGDAELYVSKRTSTQFEVHFREGEADVEFSYRIVAKRLGFEQQRLERAPWADNDPNLYPGKGVDMKGATDPRQPLWAQEGKP